MYIYTFPLDTKTAADAHGALLEHFGQDRPTDIYIWSDSAGELNRDVS